MLRQAATCQRVNRIGFRLGVGDFAVAIQLITGFYFDEFLLTLIDVELSSLDVELREVDLNGLAIFRREGDGGDACTGGWLCRTARIIEGFRGEHLLLGMHSIR